MISINDNNIIIHTLNNSMVFEINTGLSLLYFGNKIDKSDEYKWLGKDNSPNCYSADDAYSDKRLISTCGDGTNRETMIHIVCSDGSSVFRPEAVKCEVLRNKPEIKGMRSSYGESECLRVLYEDPDARVEVEQFFTVFDDSDVIASYVKINNRSGNSIYVKRFMSLQLDLGFGRYTATTLNGKYGQERKIEKREVSPGTFSIASFSGMSSNSANPYLEVSKKGVHGYSVATNLIYSGNHKEIIDYSEVSGVRILSGINDYLLDYEVKNGESFYSPEAIFVLGCSANDVSFAMRDFARKHVTRGKWKDKARPILVNSWESFFFGVNKTKIENLCREARDLGIELFVLDDGWFGKRNDDSTSLGDWVENKDKLGGTLEEISSAVRKEGLGFGIWMEPEMISVKSELFKMHPEYAMVDGNRKPIEIRNQILLDITNEKARDYVVNCIASVVKRSNAEYLKWDCNRGIYELINSGRLFYDYVIALYDILERITTMFPDLLIEGCAAGGNRFDLGMLCYVPQIWTSDNTDPRERLKIQEGTLRAYPQSAMGAHIGHNPNYHTFNSTSLKNSFIVSCAGAFGYEFDLTLASDACKKEIKNQIAFYKKYRTVIQTGKLYYDDLLSDGENAVWTAVNDDKTTAITTIAVKDYVLYAYPHRVYVGGLNTDEKYDVYEVGTPEYTEKYLFTTTGRNLLVAGFATRNMFSEADVQNDFNSIQARMFTIIKHNGGKR